MNPLSESDPSTDGQGTGTLSGGPASYVAELAAAGLPLEVGLRAFGEEAPSRRLRRTLFRMSDELARGRSPEEVLVGTGRGVPGYLRGLVRAGVRCGRLGGVLQEFLRSVRRRRDLSLRYWTAFLYPLAVLPLVCCGGVLMLSWIVPRFREIFNGFGVELPQITRFAPALGESVNFLARYWGMALLVLLVLPVCVWAIRWLPGRAARLRLWQRIPLLGTPSLMRGLSEFCSFLGLLVVGETPLPEALRLTSGVIDDVNLREGAEQLARRVEDGESIEDAVLVLPHFPASLANLFRWAHRDMAFAEALQTAGDLYASRAQVQAGIAGLFLVPWLLLIGGGFLGMLVIALFMPLIKLLNDLS